MFFNSAALKKNLKSNQKKLPVYVLLSFWSSQYECC